MAGASKEVVSIHKLRYTEHTAIHTLEIDQSVWDLERWLNPPLIPYFCSITDDHFVSQPFSADDDGEILWKIRLEPVDDPHITKVKLNIDMESKQRIINVLLYATFRTIMGIYYSNQCFGPRNPYQVLVTSSNKLECFKDPPVMDSRFEKLRFVIKYAKIKKLEEVTPHISQSSKNLTSEAESSAAHGIASLMKEQAALDVIVKAKDTGKEWKLNKCVLISASSVFEAMFNCNMKESNEGMVEIEDADSKTLDLMIKFIRNQDIGKEEMENEAENLIYLADRYDLTDLKVNCGKCLIYQLTEQNCLRLFVEADMLNAENIRHFAKETVSRYYLKLSKTDEYRNFKRSYQNLALEVADYVLQSGFYKVL